LVWYDLYQKIEKNLPNCKFLSFGWKLAYYSHIKNDFFINWKKIDISINPKIPWDHNLDNFCSILWICDIIWISFKVFQDTINNFSGLDHRLQNLWTFCWITFIDDAISTTPESTIEAIKTFKNDLETIFLWWTDRWYNFENLIKILEQSNVKNIVLFPDSWAKIKELIKLKNYNILETKSMKDAIKFAFRNTSKWKICLLSTASPSYRLWKNFEQKWNEFRNEIMNFIKTKNF
jgi:UDP-N-acetylmuramoylalanine--D-glutamate ligase